MNDPLVSIIIPTYNRAAIVTNAIKSVLEQTYQNFEILVVDDGSIDATQSTLAKIKDKRVKLISASHGGAAAARNIGLKTAQGEYIGFCDSDDLWIASKLELQINYFKQNPDVDLVFGDVVSLRGKKIETASYFGERKPHAGHVFNQLLQYNFIPNVSVLVRKSCLDQIGYFNEELKTSEDYELWLRFCLHYKVSYISEMVVQVLRHDGNITMDDQTTYSNHLSVLDLMAKKFGTLISKSALQKAYGRTYRNLTYSHILNRRWSQARTTIVQSFKHDSFSIATWRYLFVLGLPINLLNALLDHRKRLRVSAC